MPGYLREKDNGRLIVGEVIGNKQVIKFIRGLVVYLDPATLEYAATERKLASDLRVTLNPSGDPLRFIERVEPIPEGGLTFPRNGNYKPLDNRSYESIYHILRKLVI